MKYQRYLIVGAILLTLISCGRNELEEMKKVEAAQRKVTFAELDSLKTSLGGVILETKEVSGAWENIVEMGGLEQWHLSAAEAFKNGREFIHKDIYIPGVKAAFPECDYGDLMVNERFLPFDSDELNRAIDHNLPPPDKKTMAHVYCQHGHGN